MSTQKRLRLTCYYCRARVSVDFYEMRNKGSAHEALLRHGWIFGLERDGEGGVFFDPLCTTCGRGVVKQMIEAGGGKIEPDAKRSLKRIYPDLFEG